MASSRHHTAWEFLQLRTSLVHDSLNGVGPFEVPTGDQVARYLECNNYDACLGHAARNKWASFSCEGCRKAQHGRFVMEE